MVGIYLQSKENKDKKRAVYIRVRTSSGSFTISTGIRATAKDWNKKAQKLKPLTELECILNSKLAKKRELIETSLALHTAGIIDFLELKRRCLGEHSGSIQELLSIYTKEKSPKTVEAYKTPLNSLGIESISDINYNSIIKGISNWKGNLSPNSINTYVRHLISFRNDAFRRGMVDSPIAREKVYRQRVKELEVRSITREEFERALNNAKTEIQLTALRMYIFSFITRGLYYGDFKTLNPTSGVFTHYRQKTGNRMLLDGLNGLVKQLHETIPLTHLNPNKIRKYQCATKDLLDGATFKTARKTYDSYALINNVDFQIRIHLLGQRDISIKKHYTNFEMKAIQDKVSSSHKRIIKSFGAVGFAKQLLARL